MKKTKLFTLLSLGILAIGGICLGFTKQAPISVRAEGEEPEVVEPAPEAEEVYECKVILNVLEHGKVTADKMEGHVGDIVTITANPDIFYLVEYAEVNGSNIIQDEEAASREYKFALVEGENRVTVKFVIDQELLGEMSTYVEQAANKDWRNLFSLKNLISLVTVILNSGLLLVMVKYFVRDKKTQATVKTATEKTVSEVVPELVKDIVIKTIKEVIAPYFTEILANTQEQNNALVVFSRCLALAQENTPEAKIAITKELSSLKIGDVELIGQVKDKIEGFMKENADKIASIFAKIDKIEEFNNKIISSSSVEAAPEEAPDPEPEILDDGTQI